MRIAVGSKNPSKLFAVCNTILKLHPNTKCRVVVHSSFLDSANNSIVGPEVKVLLDHENAEHTVIGVDIGSAVAAQPMSASETLKGAVHRAAATFDAFQHTHLYNSSLPVETPRFPSSFLDIDYAVGLEGGVEKVDNVYFESGYIVVHSREGKLGFGTSARFQISESVMRRLQSGEELAEVVDDLSSQSDVRSTQGMMGIITNGLLPRDQCYEHGVMFAFAPFISPPQFWKP